MLFFGFIVGIYYYYADIQIVLIHGKRLHPMIHHGKNQLRLRALKLKLFGSLNRFRRLQVMQNQILYCIRCKSQLRTATILTEIFSWQWLCLQLKEAKILVGRYDPIYSKNFYDRIIVYYPQDCLAYLCYVL